MKASSSLCVVLPGLPQKNNISKPWKVCWKVLPSFRSNECFVLAFFHAWLFFVFFLWSFILSVKKKKKKKQSYAAGCTFVALETLQSVFTRFTSFQFKTLRYVLDTFVFVFQLHMLDKLLTTREEAVILNGWMHKFLTMLVGIKILLNISLTQKKWTSFVNFSCIDL